MAARAIWKAVLHLGDSAVPVKLYSAVENRSIRFRLLHDRDHAPVRQAMVNPETDDVVPYEETRRGFVTEEGDLVTFDADELAAIEPEPSRDIRVLRTVPPEVIDHRWYDRPYYLGPDGSAEAYVALIQALAKDGREGVARWTMRKKEYVGALRLTNGYPMLVTLRYAGEVLDLSALEAPAGAELDDKEVAMAGQLIGMLAESFDAGQYEDEYRERVRDLIETKRRGGTVEPAKRPKKRRPEDLSRALRASLKEARRHA